VVVAPRPPPPVPSFSGPTSIVAGQSATFVNTTTGGVPTTIVWDFGDGSARFNGFTPPPHVYLNPGTFTITLTESNPGNTPVSTTRSLIVHPVPSTVVL